MPSNIPWPRKGDELFTDGKNSWHNACTGWSHQQWIAYQEGYKRGADLLVKHIVDTHSGHDFLIYPIVFLYRQAIELSLKHLLRNGNMLLNRKPTIPKHHRLVPLWRECRPILEQVWPDGPKEDLDAVNDVLVQFEAKDPGSTVFRYPVDTSGKASMPNSERIDIQNFSEVANRILSLLEGCEAGISEYLQTMLEMQRESQY